MIKKQCQSQSEYHKSNANNCYYVIKCTIIEQVSLGFYLVFSFFCFKISFYNNFSSNKFFFIGFNF